MASPASPSLRFWHLPVNAAQHGTALDSHLLLNLWIALALLALLHLLLFVGLASRRQTPEKSTTRLRKLTLEYVPLVFFTALFAFLGLRAHALWAAQRYTGADPAALQVEVTGMQFAWYFRYPGEDAAFGQTSPRLIAPGEGNPVGLDPADAHGQDDLVRSQLTLPAGREVDLTLHAVDVIHGFAVPEMRLKQNAVPGQTAHLHFTPEVPGDYAIVCTQVCGLGHYRMNAVLHILPAADFDTWLHAQSPAISQERTPRPADPPASTTASTFGNPFASGSSNHFSSGSDDHLVSGSSGAFLSQSSHAPALLVALPAGSPPHPHTTAHP